MTIGGGVAALLLRGLSWLLFALAALMLALTALRALGLQSIAPARSDVLGAVACVALGFASRYLAAKFERLV